MLKRVCRSTCFQDWQRHWPTGRGLLIFGGCTSFLGYNKVESKVHPGKHPFKSTYLSSAVYLFGFTAISKTVFVPVVLIIRIICKLDNLL